MATRAGVGECSTSPMAQRSSARSIRASWTTGYWGAVGSISASIVSRCATTAATSSRASVGRVRSPSASARWRSRIGVGGALAEVRLEDRGQREPPAGPVAPDRRPPARGQPPTPSTSDGDRLRGRGRAGARRWPPTADRTWRGQRDERLAGPGDDPEPDADAARRAMPDDDRRGRRGARRHGGPAAADPGDARDLERGEPDELGDDAAADGQLGAAHEASSGRRPRPARRRAVAGRRSRRPRGGRSARERLGDELRDARSGPSSPPTSTREADHPPLGPAVGDDHRALDAEQRRAADPLVVEDARGSGRSPAA